MSNEELANLAKAALAEELNNEVATLEGLRANGPAAVITYLTNVEQRVEWHRRRDMLYDAGFDRPFWGENASSVSFAHPITRRWVKLSRWCDDDQTDAVDVVISDLRAWCEVLSGMRTPSSDTSENEDDRAAAATNELKRNGEPTENFPTERFFPPQHFKNVHGIDGSRLRRAALDGRLERIEVGKGRYHYSELGASRLWPTKFSSRRSTVTKRDEA